MTDKTEIEIQRGEQAARLLSEPLLVETLELIELEYTQEWKNSPVRDVEGREKLWLMVRTVQKLRSELEAVLETGKLAQHRLEQESLAQQIGRM